MTKTQFSAALKIARDTKADLSQVDDSTLFGCGLHGFVPVHCTLEMVAKLLRWQVCMWNGEIDAQELENMAWIARKRFLVV